MSHCSCVTEIICCRHQDAGWLQNHCKPKNIADNKSLGVGGQEDSAVHVCCQNSWQSEIRNPLKGLPQKSKGIWGSG